jgi:hypothetical protein
MRALYVDPADGRPDSALGAHWLTAAALAGGLAVCLLVPVVVFVASILLALLSSAVSAAAGLVIDPDAEREAVLEEEEVIQARFVQLGRDFEHELPNRQVPILSTAPPAPSQVPREQTPARERVERPEPPPPDAVDDAIARLGDRAQAFAEMAERREREGDPEGIEEGTERQGTEGDVYRGRLYSFFRRGWTIPTTMSRDDARGLTAIVNVTIGPELQIASFELRGSGSGNALFDDSITQQLARLQGADQRIPPPPEEVADQYIGRTIAVRFHGREAR